MIIGETNFTVTDVPGKDKEACNLNIENLTPRRVKALLQVLEYASNRWLSGGVEFSKAIEQGIIQAEYNENGDEHSEYERG